MKREARRVMVTLKNFDPVSQTRFEERKEGHFHCWGYRPQKCEGKPKPGHPAETVGIVELLDGKIRLVKPESIQFMNPTVTTGGTNAV